MSIIFAGPLVESNPRPWARHVTVLVPNDVLQKFAITLFAEPVEPEAKLDPR